MLNLTEPAISKIKEILQSETSKKQKLRIFVEGGGCSGFQYGFIIEEEDTGEDFNININDIEVLIDPISAQYIDGITVDFKDDLEGARFVMSNPNAKTTCGCGSSFSPY
jgi:iron-sulfur cluster insertion protein